MGVWRCVVLLGYIIYIYIYFIHFFSVSVLWQLWTSYWPTFSRNTHNIFCVYLSSAAATVNFFWRGVWLLWMAICLSQYYNIIISNIIINHSRNAIVLCLLIIKVKKLLIAIEWKTQELWLIFSIQSLCRSLLSFQLNPVHDINCIIKMQTIK